MKKRHNQTRALSAGHKTTNIVSNIKATKIDPQPSSSSSFEQKETTIRALQHKFIKKARELAEINPKRESLHIKVIDCENSDPAAATRNSNVVHMTRLFCNPQSCQNNSTSTANRSSCSSKNQSSRYYSTNSQGYSKSAMLEQQLFDNSISNFSRKTFFSSTAADPLINYGMSPHPPYENANCSLISSQCQTFSNTSSQNYGSSMHDNSNWKYNDHSKQEYHRQFEQHQQPIQDNRYNSAAGRQLFQRSQIDFYDQQCSSPKTSAQNNQIIQRRKPLAFRSLNHCQKSLDNCKYLNDDQDSTSQKVNDLIFSIVDQQQQHLNEYQQEMESPQQQSQLPPSSVSEALHNKNNKPQPQSFCQRVNTYESDTQSPALQPFYSQNQPIHEGYTAFSRFQQELIEQQQPKDNSNQVMQNYPSTQNVNNNLGLQNAPEFYQQQNYQSLYQLQQDFLADLEEKVTQKQAELEDLTDKVNTLESEFQHKQAQLLRISQELVLKQSEIAQALQSSLILSSNSQILLARESEVLKKQNELLILEETLKSSFELKQAELAAKEQQLNDKEEKVKEQGLKQQITSQDLQVLQKELENHAAEQNHKDRELDGKQKEIMEKARLQVNQKKELDEKIIELERGQQQLKKKMIAIDKTEKQLQERQKILAENEEILREKERNIVRNAADSIQKQKISCFQERNRINEQSNSHQGFQQRTFSQLNLQDQHQVEYQSHRKSIDNYHSSLELLNSQDGMIDFLKKEDNNMHATRACQEHNKENESKHCNIILNQLNESNENGQVALNLHRKPPSVPLHKRKLSFDDGASSKTGNYTISTTLTPQTSTVRSFKNFMKKI